MELEDLNNEGNPPIEFAPTEDFEVALDPSATVVKEEAAIGPDGLPIEFPENEDTTEATPEEDQGEAQPPPLRVKRFATIMNILNSLLGAGILSVPNSFLATGIVPSIFIITLIAILSHICAVMTIKLERRANADGLDDLVFKVFGKVGSICVSIGSMLFCISCMVAYLVISAGTIESWLEAGGILLTEKWQRYLLVLLNSIILPCALTLPRTIKFLGPCSTITTFFICFYAVAMIAKAIIIFPKREYKPEIVIAKAGMGLFSSISIYGLAFALPVVVLPLLHPYNPDLKKRSIASGSATLMCYVLVVIPSIIGYMMYGEDTAILILDNFDAKDVLMIIVRGGFYFVASFSYPAIGQSLMSAWSNIFYSDDNQGELSTLKRIPVLAATNIIPVVIAVFLPNARPALSIGGAMGGCLVDFFFPAIMWLKLSKKKLYHPQNIACIILAIFGIGTAIISTYQAVVDAIDAFTE